MQPAKTRGYATCMVFGEGGRFVRDVGARFRSQDFKILLVYEPIRLQNRRRNCDLRACETFGDVRSQRKLPFMKQQLVRSQIAQERTRAAENAELRRRNEEAEEQEFGRDEEDTSGEGKAVRIFLVWLPPGSSI